MYTDKDSNGVSRRELLRAGAVGAGGLSAAAFLAAYGGSDAIAKTSAGHALAAASDKAPVRGGTLRVGFLTGGNTETIDPRKIVTNQDISRCNNLYDQLFFSEPDGTTRPGLAEEAIPTDGAKLWTLKLRRGVTWHDGKAFTADDVVYTIKASWGSKDSAFYTVATELFDLSAVRKRGAYTVEVPLRRAIADFPTLTCLLGTWIVQDGTTDFTRGIGTGPFKLKSFTPGTSSLFAANKEYWMSGLPYVDALDTNTSFASDAARMNALLGGDIDIAPQPPFALSKANANSKQIVLGNAVGPGFNAVTMRLDDKPFDDVRVRQALRLLANRRETLSGAFDGYGTIGNDIPGQTLPYWASDLKRAADPERARSLLKAAGHRNLNLTLLTSPYLPGMVELATLYAQQAQAAGVNVRVDVVNPSIYWTPSSPGGAYPTKPFSVNNWGLGMTSMAALYLTCMPRGCPYPETDFGSRSHDALLYDAAAETNPARAADKWHAVQELQFNHGGYIIAVNLNFLDAYSPKVRGVKTTSAGPSDNFFYSRAWLAA